MRSAEELERFFHENGIDCSSIEFYNQPAFATAERKTPLILAAYGEYVEWRHYNDDYRERARRVVPKVIAYLRRELAMDGRQGACLDAAFAVMKIFEQLGIWCHITGGSLTVEFDPETRRPRQFWAHIFERADAVGHAWLVAPPFKVIDLTISQQVGVEDIKEYIPDYVVTEETGPVAGVSLEDMLDRDFERKMRRSGYRIPTIHELMKHRPDIAEMMTTFRPFSVRFPPATLKYFPCQPCALQERFEAAKTHCFSGRTMPELFRDLIREIGLDIGWNNGQTA